MTPIATNRERLTWYLAAEQKILMQQSVETAEGEKLTLANLGTVRGEIQRLQQLIANERRSVVRRNYLE
ncbi:hypothetical protein [Vibrio coralliilyticus]|uniref:hypothetical protein n=1 Tax=Vibrio coralliilyticus TaxID=190893 RepID=UPI001E632469|nr:hypothetical protein [Vibrio coralliilyticus]MCC2521068.1 hypothetical protein [Vibrio coralliilyticus]